MLYTCKHRLSYIGFLASSAFRTFSLGVAEFCELVLSWSFIPLRGNTTFNYCGSARLVLQCISVCKHQIVLSNSSEK